MCALSWSSSPASPATGSAGRIHAVVVANGRQATLGVSPKATGVRRARPITTTGSIAAGGASPLEFNKLVYEPDLISGTGVS